jgi:ribosome assembly protein YihI (activator of Der GTPase)
MKKKEPDPRPEYTEKQKDYAKYLLTLPAQYDLHHKPDDYLRTLQKEGKKSRSRTSASGSKSSISTSKKRSDVPQLGQQAKQSIPPLRVLSEIVASPVQGQSLEIAKNWADEWGMSVEDVLASQDEKFPKAIISPKPKFVMGGPLVSKKR